MAARMLSLGALAAIQLGHAVRFSEEALADSTVLQGGAEDPEVTANSDDDNLLVGHGYCCCKSEPCSVVAKSDSGDIEAVYSPNQGTCCKLKKRTCGNWLQFWSGYSDKAASEDYCHPNRPQDQVFELPKLQEWCASGTFDELSGTCCPNSCGSCGGAVGTGCESRLGGAACCYASNDCKGRYETGCKKPENVPTTTPEPIKNYEPGTVGHTVHNFCNFSGHADHDPANEEPVESVKHKIVKQIVEQLEDNSIDQMAKSMFAIYICVRWVPTPEFTSMAENEIRTEQLEDRKVLDHYEDFTFMPLKCTENFAVYDNRESFNTTFFEKFESEMESQAHWYNTEGKGVIAKRLLDINKARSRGNKKLVEELTKAFDLPHVKTKANCVTNQNKILVDTFKSTPEQLLNDCAAAKWWLSKLSDWHRSMPFSTFMLPSKDVDKKARPGDAENVMLCFGKRVASELHRRKEGGHLMTDQTTVGCHGFYDFPLAQKMTERIVRLWRPPTCQLAAMELDFKVKILQMMEDMNDRLFDALPSLILEEETGITNFDGTRLEPAGSLGVLSGIWKSISTRFNFFKTKYTRLGALLGGTTVKWVVCPLNIITNQSDLDRLDEALGSEDHVSRYYSRIAYQRHTGEKELLPGEQCDDAVSGLSASIVAKKCPLGQLRANMPEPYKAEKFMCPIIPLMPAKQQLQVFEGKENMCVLHMDLEQQKKHGWFYRGHHPSQLQYNQTVNNPESQYRTAKIISYRRTPDHRLNIFRDFARIGLWCSYAEVEATPRWCQKPKVLNDDMASRNLLTNIPLPKFSGISNSAITERFGAWFYRNLKGTERWFRRQSTEWAGRAKKRYDKFYAKSFIEVEASEMLHSMTFQEHLGDSGGDSKGNDKYERYVVTVPCEGFMPDNMFKMKYQWAEYGMQLIRKTKADWNKDDTTLGSKYFSVDVRGDAVLHLRDEKNAWVDYWSHIRAFGYEKEKPAFKRTKNPIMEALSGALDPRLASKVQASDLRGFRATFACGGKKAMHDLDMKAIAIQQTTSFAECVNQGIEKNKELRKKNPSAPFLSDEIVVRMFISELPSCYKQVAPDMIQNANETENHVYSNFVKAVSECEPVAGELPSDLEKATKAKTFRGVLLGQGAPPNTLEEVLMDPEDVKREVGL